MIHSNWCSKCSGLIFSGGKKGHYELLTALLPPLLFIPTLSFHSFFACEEILKSDISRKPKPGLWCFTLEWGVSCLTIEHLKAWNVRGSVLISLSFSSEITTPVQYFCPHSWPALPAVRIRQKNVSLQFHFVAISSALTLLTSTCFWLGANNHSLVCLKLYLMKRDEMLTWPQH